MAGTMSRFDLVDDLKASLHDAAEVFTDTSDTDFFRLLDVAALDFSRVRPRTLIGSTTLIAGQNDYALPADFYLYKADLWADPQRMGHPWEKSWPGRLPSVRVAEIAGVRKIVLQPAPNERQIAQLGADFKFYYLAKHEIGTDVANTSIEAGDRGLFLLRAQAEAMRELAMRNVGKPVSMRDGLTSAPRNGTPSHLFTVLMAEFERAAA